MNTRGHGRIILAHSDSGLRRAVQAVVEDLLELSRLAQVLSENAGGSNRDRPRMPKYLRLSDCIAGAVEAGELKPGERLPGESELAKGTQVVDH